MGTVIVPFEPGRASRQEWARFHAYRRTRHQETEPEDPLLDDETVETMMKQSDPMTDFHRFAVIVEQAPGPQVGFLEFEVFKEGSPTYDKNPHLAWMTLAVLAPYRRRGIGTALLAKSAELARGFGKSTLATYTHEPDGKAFLERVGFAAVQTRRENRLQLDRLDWRMVEGWAREGPARSPRSSLHWCIDGIDEVLLKDYCRVYTEVFNQQPFDALSMNDVVFTPEGFREWESNIHAIGGTLLTAMTREADGDISGLTEMWYLPGEESLIRQGMTGVRELYRGRGLGKWLKAAMLLRIREEFPKVKVVVTGNASSNAAIGKAGRAP